MPKFSYVATNTAGQNVEGKLDAATMAEARGALAEQGLNVIRLDEVVGILKRQVGGKVKPFEIMHMSRELAAFVRAGVPLLDGLEVIAAETETQKLRSALREIAESLRSGERLSSAFAAHQQMLPGYYVDMLRAAELTGRLDEVLDDIASYMERDIEARQSIKSALTYPTVIFVLSLVVIAVLLGFVVPRFQPFFESLGGDLPLQTRILLSVTRFIGDWWWVLLMALVAFVVFVSMAGRTTWGKGVKDRMILRLPAIGTVLKYAILERACRILAAMVRAGVPLPQAIQVTADGTNNAIYKKSLLDVREAMMGGEGLSAPLARTQLVPATLVQIVRVGEETGTLDEQLDTAARFFHLELGYKIRRLTTFFEPAVIIAAGVFVGYVAIAVVSALFSIYNRIGSI